MRLLLTNLLSARAVTVFCIVWINPALCDFPKRRCSFLAKEYDFHTNIMHLNVWKQIKGNSAPGHSSKNRRSCAAP